MVVLVAHEAQVGTADLREAALDESFVADPEGQLRAICPFLDLPPAPRRPEVRSDINRAYFDSWLAMRRRPDGWLCMRTLVVRFERRFLDYGYALRALEGAG